jgi:hypothetical protein
MKLPLIAVVIGVLIGIALVMWVQPRTPGGTGLIIFVAILVTTAVVLAAGKLLAWVQAKRS